MVVSDELNILAHAGKIVPIGAVGLFGAQHVALASGTAELQRVDILPAGGAGRIFYWASGWRLIANGRTVAEWMHPPHDVAGKCRSYARAHRWLLLKAQKSLNPPLRIPVADIIKKVPSGRRGVYQG